MIDCKTRTQHNHIRIPLHHTPPHSSFFSRIVTTFRARQSQIARPTERHLSKGRNDPHTADHPLYIDRQSTFIMAMTLDQRSHHLSGMNFDHLPYTHSPQFSNPWASSQSAPHAPQLYPTSMGASSASFDALKQQPNVRSNTPSMPYSSAPVSATSLPATNGYAPYAPSNLLDMSQDLLKPEFPRPAYEHGYSAPPSSISSYAPTSAPYAGSYSTLAPSQPSDEIRRLSQSWVLPTERSVL